MQNGGITIGDSRLVATHFNEFFCTTGANLAKNFIDIQPNSFTKYLQQRISSSIYSDIPNPTEIENVVHSLNLNKAVGYDNIPPFFLRTVSTVITTYLHLFREFCFCNGTFPEDCATAKIVPIFKKGKKDDPLNYRPISILTCFSKIMEKIIYKRQIFFLNKHKVIQKNQFGCQSNVSTNHALVDVISSCFDNINDNLFTGLIFLDLTKAFDTVNHEILLHKLDHYNIRGQANNLLRTFLKRRQYVLINNNVPPPLCNNIGVPQGSILGPLLFLLYINDLQFSVSCNPRLFADDTCLVCSYAKLPVVASKMNNNLHRVSLWLKGNKLTVNPPKYMHY